MRLKLKTHIYTLSSHTCLYSHLSGQMLIYVYICAYVCVNVFTFAYVQICAKVRANICAYTILSVSIYGHSMDI